MLFGNFYLNKKLRYSKHQGVRPGKAIISYLGIVPVQGIIHFEDVSSFTLKNRWCQKNKSSIVCYPSTPTNFFVWRKKRISLPVPWNHNQTNHNQPTNQPTTTNQPKTIKHPSFFGTQVDGLGSVGRSAPGSYGPEAGSIVEASDLAVFGGGWEGCSFYGGILDKPRKNSKPKLFLYFNRGYSKR